MTCPMNPKACPMNPDGCPIRPFNTLRSLKAYYSIYMSLNTLDLPPFDRVLNTLQCVVRCGHLMRRQPVISEFKVAISKKCTMKVSKVAKIRNRYNQVPHLTQDTNGKVTNSQKTPQTRAKRSALSQQVTTKHI